MAAQEFQGEVRDTTAYKLGFADRKAGNRSSSRFWADPLDRKAYLIGYLSERHRSE